MNTSNLKYTKGLGYIALMMIMVTAACKKETGTGSSSTTFLPGKAGSTWNYESKNFINSTTGTFVMTKTSKDTAISGRTYGVYSISGGANSYFYQSSADYYQFTPFAGTTSQVELLYLKSNVNSGLSWDQDITIAIPGIGNVTAKVTSKVEAKGISYSVGGKTYSDVTQIKTTIGAFTIPGLPIAITPISDINSFYSAGVGRIYSRSKVNITIPTVPPINVDDETTLKSHNIVQ